MAEKKYYWLKMTDQFFEDKAIKKLRKIAGGDTYTIIYLKMLLTAIKQGNKMYFEGIEDDFMEELALELDEDTDNVKVRIRGKARLSGRLLMRCWFTRQQSTSVILFLITALEMRWFHSSSKERSGKRKKQYQLSLRKG